MKRVKSACLEQTLHFILKEDIRHEEAAELVRREVAAYKEKLNRTHTQYKIVDEAVQPDDSIVIKIKKQYNRHACGEYMQMP